MGPMFQRLIDEHMDLVSLICFLSICAELFPRPVFCNEL